MCTYINENNAENQKPENYSSPQRTRVRTWQDGSHLDYAQGKFDGWCVFLTDADGNVHAPRDKEYFLDMRRFADRFGAEKVYSDFVRIYELTGKRVSDDVLSVIDEISATYGTSRRLAEIVFTVLYMGMIAEENKVGTKLGKRIKRLGMYVLLNTGADYRIAANFMRGMGWRDISELCLQYGF